MKRPAALISGSPPRVCTVTVSTPAPRPATEKLNMPSAPMPRGVRKSVRLASSIFSPGTGSLPCSAVTGTVYSKASSSPRQRTGICRPVNSSCSGLSTPSPLSLPRTNSMSPKLTGLAPLTMSLGPFTASASLPAYFLPGTASRPRLTLLLPSTRTFFGSSQVPVNVPMRPVLALARLAVRSTRLTLMPARRPLSCALTLLLFRLKASMKPSPV